MSPLVIVIMKLLRWGVLGIAMFLGLVLVIEAWKHGGELASLNWGFMGVVVLLAAGGAVAGPLHRPGTGQARVLNPGS